MATCSMLVCVGVFLRLSTAHVATPAFWPRFFSYPDRRFLKLAQEQAAQLPGGGWLTHLQLPGGVTLAQLQQQQRQQVRHPPHQQHRGHHHSRDRQHDHQQRSTRAVGGGREDSYGRRDGHRPQQHYSSQGHPSYLYPSGSGRMIPHAVRVSFSVFGGCQQQPKNVLVCKCRGGERRGW